MSGQRQRYVRELRNRWLAVRLSLRGQIHQYPEILALRMFLTGFAIDCVIDVGANQGQYATTLRRDVGFGGTILSFEPNPEAFSILERRAAGDRRWHVFNMALSDFDGTAQFNIMAAEQFSSLERPAAELDPIFTDRNKVTRQVEMQCRRLSGLLPELRAAHGFIRPFLKMDTQGHDLSVCEGAGEMLADLTGLQTELAVRPIYEGGTAYRAMIEWLDGRGFAPSAFFANNKGHFPLLVEMDGIFVNRALLARMS
ncbi:FkbM family methyltransferase [Sphingobium aromaticiconvertens]|uniref:FkbM family methyltransferase n=1 Tax=Sphingobium aromaticiconvertens TaxID=365341 RepID=UPI003017CF91